MSFCLPYSESFLIVVGPIPLRGVLIIRSNARSSNGLQRTLTYAIASLIS